MYSVCALVAALIRPLAAGQEDIVHGQDQVIQMNHYPVGIPSAGQAILTKDGERIWLQNIRLTDKTGSLTISERQNGACVVWACLKD